MNIIMLRLIIISLFICSSVFSAEDSLFIRGFGGLNTISDEFHVGENEATVAHNVDFSRQLGAISKRYGYDSLSAFVGADSIWIYPVEYSDGTKQLFVVTDTANQGFGSIYVTKKGSYSLNADSLTKIWSFWSPFGVPDFETVGDRVYIVNGYNRGIVYSDGVARSFPPRSPAEPYITPLKEAGGLSGTYRYVIYISDTTTNTNTIDTIYDTTRYECAYWKSGYCVEWVESVDGDSIVVDISYDTVLSANSHLRQGVVSSPVRVDDGAVMLTGFTAPNVDSVKNYSDPYDAGFRITIARTRGDFLRLTERTKVYHVTDFLVPDADSAEHYVYIDTTSDTTLTNYIELAIQRDMLGVDSTNSIHTRYGAPGYMGITHTHTYTSIDDTPYGDSTSAYGVFYGIPNQEDTLGVAYYTTVIDTVTGIESDTGRGCYVWNDQSQFSGAAKPFGYQLSLPKILDNDSGLVYNVYRGLIEQITFDSSYWKPTTISNLNLTDAFRLIDAIGKNKEITIGDTILVKDRGVYRWVDNMSVDTVIVQNLYLVGQYTRSDTMFIDSLRYDSLVLKRTFYKKTPPALMSSIFAFQGRLYGVEKSRLWRSGLLDGFDSLQTWGQMDFQSFNEDDGDIGTIAFPERQAIRFFKNRSNYNVYDDFSKTEISGYWGCIAPQSYAAGIGGIYYLTDEGVVRETEGTDLERTFKIQLVSAKLDNFDKMDIKTKSRSYGFYHNQKYYLYVPSPIDTTYIFDERANAWSTASLKFSSAGLYGIQPNVEFIPGDTIYFTRPGSSGLYRLGSSEKDNGNSIPINWQSAPLFVDHSYEKVGKIGLWCESDSTYDSLAVYIKDEDANTDGYAYFSNLTSRYVKRGISCNSAMYFYINLSSFAGADLHIGKAYIDGIDIWYERQGVKEIE